MLRLPQTPNGRRKSRISPEWREKNLLLRGMREQACFGFSNSQMRKEKVKEGTEMKRRKKKEPTFKEWFERWERHIKREKQKEQEK